jgi:DNA (cytosine-5)-methyltransferase 1
MFSKDMNTFIPVIDLFAGPGGLGEGFSAFCDNDGQNPFKIALSIEKETNAHSTLELRAFFREFNNSTAPKDYYNYVRGEITRGELFKNYPEQASKAQVQAWHAELGCRNPSNGEIDQRIRDAINNHDSWVLIGGPPCQAYSIVGRSRMKNHKVDFENDQRHFLYKEYLRIVAIHRPPVFVMENVKGILSSKLNGENVIDKILRDLRNPVAALFSKTGTEESNSQLSYHIYSLVKPALDDTCLMPKDYVIKSEKFGIPQKRHRVILLGIRSDLAIRPTALSEASEQYPVERTINDLPKLRSGVSKEKDSPEIWGTILQNIPKSDWVKSALIPPTLRDELCSQSLKINCDLDQGSRFLLSNNKPDFAAEWFYDANLHGICNHMSRSHMRSDLYRYFFASCFSKVYGRSPKLNEFPAELLPNHNNVNSGVRGKMFADRFRVQVSDEPSTTIMSHISKDGHYYIHPDPTQCRSLTVREAARLQTFPDNYFFEGNQTAQYHQVGNAVPPLLAAQIAMIVNEIIKIR